MAQNEVNIREIIQVAQLFPRYADEECNNLLMVPVEKKDIELIIKYMQVNKSPRQDGWTVELFQHFFELMGTVITNVVEESRSQGLIHDSIRSTFLDLIPKCDSPTSFDHFHPISICKCIYKIISKIISNRLNLILSYSISKENFGFLDGRQVHEAIGIAQ